MSNRRVSIARLGSALVAGAMLVGMTGGVAVASPPAAGAFTVRAVNANPADPSPLSYFKVALGSGRSAVRQIVITNPTSSPITVLVNGVDGLTGQTSGSVYANRQDRTAKAGLWVASAIKSAVVGPGSSLPVSFTIRVPRGTYPGDHLAGIAVENANPTTSGSGFKIKEVLRTVIGVLVQIPGPARFHPHLLAVGLQKLAGPRVGAVLVRLGDDGRALGKPVLKVTLAGPSRYSKTIIRTLDTLLPGDVISFPLSWPDNLPAGKYTINAWLTGGGVTAHMASNVTSTTSMTGVQHLALIDSTPNLGRHSSSGATTWILLVFAGAAGLGGGLFMRRRPRVGSTPQA